MHITIVKLWSVLFCFARIGMVVAWESVLNGTKGFRIKKAMGRVVCSKEPINLPSQFWITSAGAIEILLTRFNRVPVQGIEKDGFHIHDHIPCQFVCG